MQWPPHGRKLPALLLGYGDGCVNNKSKGSEDATGRGRNRELPVMTLMGDRNRELVLCYECTLRSGGTALGRLRRTETHSETLSQREVGE